MDGAFQALKVGGKFCVVEDFARKHREDAHLRLARITNNSHPEYRNGHPKTKEKSG